jgi:hypothetical protein
MTGSTRGDDNAKRQSADEDTEKRRSRAQQQQAA